MYIDSQGRYRTEGLFLETNKGRAADGFKPVYTLKPRETKGLPSAYQIYMDSVNEYEAATRLVGDMRHWRKLCKLKWFMEGNDTYAYEGLNQWREDKRMKDEAAALNLLKEQAEGGSVTAQKTLLDAVTNKNQYSKTGRPKKEADTSLQDERTAKILSLHKSLKK